MADIEDQLEISMLRENATSIMCLVIIQLSILDQPLYLPLYCFPQCDNTDYTSIVVYLFSRIKKLQKSVCKFTFTITKKSCLFVKNLLAIYLTRVDIY